jgi:hypothetical protein
MKNKITIGLLLSSTFFVKAQTLGTLPLLNTTSPTGTLDYIGTYVSNDMIFGTYFNKDVAIFTHNTERMRFKGNGLIGIGTKTPTEKLDIFGNLKVSGNGMFGGTISSADIKTDSIQTKTPGVNLIHKSPSLFNSNIYIQGNTGLGNTSPTERLDITGNMKVSGNSSIGGNTFMNGTLNVIGNSTLNELLVNLNTTLSGNLNVQQNSFLNTLNVTGLTNFNNHVLMTQNLNIGGQLTVAGDIQTSSGVIFPDGKKQTKAVIFEEGLGKVERFAIGGTGSDGGTTAKTPQGQHADYALSVYGKGVFKEIIVTDINWADYVFDKEYKLKKLSEVKQFIETNKHLPDVPSETEVKTNGISVGEMDATLLKKIEELTLYIIELEERMNKLETSTK